MFFRILETKKITQKDFRWDIGFSRSRKKEKLYGTHNYKPEGKWNITANVMVDNFKDSGHPVFRASCALDRGSWKERWTMYDSLQRGIFECRALVSHTSFSKSFQYLRSSSELMWWIDSANAWSIIFKRGDPLRRWMSSYVEHWSLRKWTRWYEHLGRMFKQRGIDCVPSRKIWTVLMPQKNRKRRRE